MDPKDVKRILKEAKEAIKAKDPKSAVKICKTVLKVDRNNYFALVLLGAALQESDDQHEEAPKAYRKASEVSPDQPVAWQGLVSYYEKYKKSVTPEIEECLVKAYAYLIPVESDTSKKQEYATRLGDLAVRFQCPGECSSVLKKLPTDKGVANAIRRSMVKALLQMKELQNSDTILLGEALEAIIHDWKESRKGNDFDIQEFYRQFLKFLYRNGDHKKLLQEANLMAETFNKDPYPLEWICKLWVEHVAEGKDISVLKDSINNIVTRLQTLSPSSSSASMAIGTIYYCQSDLSKAREELLQAILSSQAPWHVYLLLADVQLKCGLASEALNLLAEAKTRAKHLSDVQKSILKKYEAESLIATQQQDNLLKGCQLCEELLTVKVGDPSLHLLLARAYVVLQRPEEAQKHLTEIGSLSTHASTVILLQAQILVQSGHKEQASSVLESIATDAKDPEVWLALARLHQDSERKENVLTYLMEAARCRPYFWETFMILGNLYKSMATPGSLDKARRCYLKALHLNAKSEEAARQLSDVLLLLHDIDNHIDLLNKMTQTSNSKWIWLRLGLLHTEQGEVENAVNYLCNAVRIDPMDSLIWESLGDAYMVRGAWHAALKSFQKAEQLSPGNIYASYQIGTVQLRLEEYEEALLSFKHLLELAADYVPALQGLGEAAQQWAIALRDQQRLGCARDRCQEAIDAFTRVLCQRQDLSCTWKLLGDTCLFCAKLPASYATFQLKEWLVCPSLDSCDSSSITLKQLDMFLLAEKMYCRAMSISEGSGLLWHDLATTNFWHAMATPQSNKRGDMLQRAWTAAQHAVSLNPENFSFWNTLGVVAATEEIKKLAVAQHAFIQSILLNNASPVPWTNLGCFYLILGKIELANKSFSAAQRLDHDYTRCWVGQAMIAEVLYHRDNDNIHFLRETLSLYQHTVSLKYHHESCSGYADWVLRILLTNEGHTELQMEQSKILQDMSRIHAVEVAADCMKWYTERHESDPCGWNMLGLLLERQKLLRSAQVAFQKGLEKATLAVGEPEQLNALLCNLGRVLIGLQDYQKSIDIHQQVSVPSLSSQSGLALALFKAQRFEEAYEVYNTTHEWLARDDETKAHIFMAMAAMLYGFNQLEECKTLLFQSIQPKPLSAHPLMALCAIGLLHKDIAMSKIMLKELGQFKDNPKYLVDIALLASLTAFIQGDQKGALQALGKAVHRHPGEGRLWLSLAHVQMHAYPNCDAVAIRRVSQAALRLGRANIDVSKVEALVSATLLLSGDGVSAAVSSQKAVHQFPNVAENWALLAASLLPLDRSPQHAAWLRDLISHVRRRLQPSAGGLKKWLGNCEHLLTSLSST